VAMWFATWASVLLTARITGSNPVGGIDVSLLCLLCVVLVAASATG